MGTSISTATAVDVAVLTTFCLYPYQVQHVEKLREKWTKFPIVFDISQMGSGKTATAVEAANHFDVAFVLYPAMAIGTWQREATRRERNGFATHLLSIQQLRGSLQAKDKTLQGFHAMKHGLLDRRVEEMHKGDKRYGKRPRAFERSVTGELVFVNRKGAVEYVSSFRPTKEFVEFVYRYKVLVIIDEFHNGVAEDTSTQRAFAALARAILLAWRAGGHSRMLCMSATAFDKQEHAASIISAMIVGTPLHVPKMDAHGRVEMVLDTEVALPALQAAFNDFVKDASPDTRHRFATRWPRWSFMTSREQVNSRLYELFMEFAWGPLTVKMGTPTVLDARSREIQQFVLHVLFELRNQGLQDQLTALLQDMDDMMRKRIARASKRREDWTPQDFADAEDDQRSMIVMLMTLEAIKAYILVRLIDTALTTNPLCKVVVAVSYTDTIAILLDLLKGRWNPIILTGSTSTSTDRVKFTQEFQEPSLRRRLIIGNLRAMSASIDLDDVTGCFPRIAFITPSFFHLDAHQFLGRFYRANTKSDSMVAFVYAASSAAAVEVSNDMEADAGPPAVDDVSGLERDTEIRILSRLQLRSAVLKAVNDVLDEDAGDVERPEANNDGTPAAGCELDGAVQAGKKVSLEALVKNTKRATQRFVGTAPVVHEGSGDAISQSLISGRLLLYKPPGADCVGADGRTYTTEEVLDKLATASGAGGTSGAGMHISVVFFWETYRSKRIADQRKYEAEVEAYQVAMEEGEDMDPPAEPIHTFDMDKIPTREAVTRAYGVEGGDVAGLSGAGRGAKKLQKASTYFTEGDADPFQSYLEGYRRANGGAEVPVTGIPPVYPDPDDWNTPSVVASRIWPVSPARSPHHHPRQENLTSKPLNSVPVNIASTTFSAVRSYEKVESCCTEKSPEVIDLTVGDGEEDTDVDVWAQLLEYLDKHFEEHIPKYNGKAAAEVAAGAGTSSSSSSSYFPVSLATAYSSQRKPGPPLVYLEAFLQDVAAASGSGTGEESAHVLNSIRVRLLKARRKLVNAGIDAKPLTDVIVKFFGVYGAMDLAADCKKMSS